MTSYDALTVSSPLDMMRLAHPEVNDVSDAFPHGLNFHGEAMFANVQDGLQLPFTPSYDVDGFSATIEDPIGYQSNIFETFLDEAPNNPESIPIDTDNCKLLGFGSPIHKTPVFDQAGQTWPRMSAELNGMFCVAEDVFEGDTSGRPLELTCYRRNLFQISGTISLSRTIGHVLLDHCRQSAIYDLVAKLSATESIEGKPTDIITVPWKTNGAHAEEKIGASPTADIPIDLTSNQETDPMFVSIPVAWGRLQFKYATANNGRRKGLQQHYRIRISLMAKIEGDGQLIKLAEIQSNPIVVRGRSPKNFDSSKDVPLSERKVESVSRVKSSSVNAALQWIEPALSQSQKHYTPKPTQSVFESPSWTGQSPTNTSLEHRSKKFANSPSRRRRPPVPQTQWSDEFQENNSQSSNPAVDLSHAGGDQQRHASISSFSSPEKQAPKNSESSPLESADHLYEYFPLSLDDWMAPVDAIYRPHVVHHLRITPDLKAQQVRAKPKRYFSAED